MDLSSQKFNQASPLSTGISHLANIFIDFATDSPVTCMWRQGTPAKLAEFMQGLFSKQGIQHAEKFLTQGTH